LGPTPDCSGKTKNKKMAHAKKRDSRVWVWFVALMVVQLAAWTGWFMIASNHPVEEVPLVGVPLRQ